MTVWLNPSNEAMSLWPKDMLLMGKVIVIPIINRSMTYLSSIDLSPTYHQSIYDLPIINRSITYLSSIDLSPSYHQSIYHLPIINRSMTYLSSIDLWPTYHQPIYHLPIINWSIYDKSMSSSSPSPDTSEMNFLACNSIEVFQGSRGVMRSKSAHAWP